MFARVASVFVLALPLLGSATAIRRNDLASAVNDCNSGALQCCNSVQNPASATSAAILASFGIPVGSFTGLLGLTCSPLSAFGASGTSCSQEAVCCTGNSFNGVIATGCTPFNFNV